MDPVDVLPPPPILSGADVDLVNPWVEGVHASHDAMQWAYAEERRALQAKKVALVVDNSEDGFTPRWVFSTRSGRGGKTGAASHSRGRSAPCPTQCPTTEKSCMIVSQQAS